MKKTLFLFLIVLITVSCEDSTKDIKTKVVDLTVNSNEWIESVDAAGLNRFYSCHFNMPEITPAVFNSGTVTTYIEYTNPVSQQNLPVVRHFENAASALWTQTIDYDYADGGMTIYVTNSDFVSDPPTGTMNFHVVLMW